MKQFLSTILILLLGLQKFSSGLEVDNGSAEVSQSGIMTKVQGQSGKITVGPPKDNGSGDKSIDNDKAVVIEMDAIKEIDANGQVVGSQGKSNDDKHSRETFANTEFAFNTVLETKSLGSASATTFNFTASLVGDASLAVTVFLVKESGSYSVGDETYQLAAGDMKFNTVIENWPFCDSAATSGDASCQGNEHGEFLDFDITVSTKQAAAESGSVGARGKTYAIGNNATLALSGLVNLDSNSTWTAMPEGYPAVSQSGTKTTFTFRFPRFTSSAVYDPVFQGLQDPTASISEASGKSSTLAACLLVVAPLLMNLLA